MEFLANNYTEIYRAPKGKEIFAYTPAVAVLAAFDAGDGLHDPHGMPVVCFAGMVANSVHNGNLSIFHRVKDFRKLVY
ncbi:MAG: hypothetical protein IJ493_11225 [Clostridia bacterium]|nr:hypothetical protein [Clostridia bacterium]